MPSLRIPPPGEEEALHHFFKFELKVTPCPKRYTHDWVDCPFAHAGERAARRDPRRHRIAGVSCVEFKQKGKCAQGDACPNAHNGWELWLSEERYRTALCKLGAACTRKYCFFAHNLSELRLPGGQPAQRARRAQQPPAQQAQQQQQQQQAAHSPRDPHASSPGLYRWPGPQAISSGAVSSSARSSMLQQPCRPGSHPPAAAGGRCPSSLQAAAALQHPQASSSVSGSGRRASPEPGGGREGPASATPALLYPTPGIGSLESGPGTPRRWQDAGRPFPLPSSVAVALCTDGQAAVVAPRLAHVAAHQPPLVQAAAAGEPHPGMLSDDRMAETIQQAVTSELLQGRLGPRDALALLNTLLPAFQQLSMQQPSMQQQAPAVTAVPAVALAAPSAAASGHLHVRGSGQLQRASAPATLYTNALWGQGPAQQAWTGPWPLGSGEA